MSALPHHLCAAMVSVIIQQGRFRVDVKRDGPEERVK